MITERALYGIKSPGAACRGKRAETLMLIGSKSSDADDDIWMKQEFKPNGDPYYKYMICIVDDLIHIGFKPKEDMDVLNMIYWLKEVFGPSEQYLGSNVGKV